jgi:hypothetical protein
MRDRVILAIKQPLQQANVEVPFRTCTILAREESH